MTPPESNIGAAIAALECERLRLEAERTHLGARLGKVDDALKAMRDLFHLPGAAPARRATKAVAGTPVARRNGGVNGDDRAAAILEALRSGPKSPAELVKAIGVERFVLRVAVRALEAAGRVVATGSTGNRRIALAGKPAKEAP